MFFVVGVLSLIYYLVLCISTRKAHSTFSLFWIFLSAGCILGERIVQWMPSGVRSMFDFVVLVLAVLFLTVEAKLILAARGRIPKDVRYIIVLGAQVRGKRVTDSLKRRLDVSYEYAVDHPDAVLIVSGGQGKDEEVSEASAMKEYLLERGISSDRIYMEECSSSTYENLKNSKEFIEDMEAKVGIATNDFHVFRAIHLAKKLGYKSVFGICAGTKAVLKPNYMVREFFAVCKGVLIGKL